MPITIKRIYDEASDDDGFRVLVDRLWPRGISKERARIDLWVKDVAPSTELRQWFHHDAANWEEFLTRYRKELAQNKTALDELRATLKGKPKVTLLYGAKDEKHNQALILKDILSAPS